MGLGILSSGLAKAVLSFTIDKIGNWDARGLSLINPDAKFLFERDILAGAGVMLSPWVSSWRVSPGASCNRSRRRLGRTTRPALSSVTLPTMLPL
jgi:hypothetical protein